MTKEEVSKFIIDKQIPLQIIWKNNTKYYLHLYCDDTLTIGYDDNNAISIFKNNHFPNWVIVNYSGIFIPKIGYWNQGTNIFLTENDNIEKCLSEFLYWFEINKSICKEITYYK